ncbi:MAG: hypothetical protein BWZ08_02132 [candidate division BRC1 bacterium ADurb.BinA292]|nr:MAG: hypothetical protein BWZ08_02132 [candidate division BRC1 bacterium ADurb.BinA292]
MAEHRTAEEWLEILRGVTRERLARECRERIVTQDLKTAAQRAAALLQRARGERELEDHARFLGRALGELHRDVDRSRKVIAALGRAGGQAGQGAAALAASFEEFVAQGGPRQFEATSQAWYQQLTEAVLSLRDCLPGPNEAGEPTEEQIARFRDELLRILKAGAHQRDPDDFIDALSIVVEYCPKDPSPFEGHAGLGDRMFLQLGPRAKLTAVRTMVQLGELDNLRGAILKFADSADAAGRAKLLTGIMGGMRHADFFPWLKRGFEKASSDLEESWFIDALGRINEPRAAEILLERLEKVVKRLGEKGAARRAELLITALGRVARLRGIDPDRRNQVIQKVLATVERGDRALVFKATAEMFSVRLQELDPQLLRWAAQHAVDAMWGPPLDVQGTRISVNGWREPMVETLRRLGRNALDEILEAGRKHAAHYSAAMAALANALQTIGDERSVPLLEAMIRTALFHDEAGPRSQVLEEKVLDAASGELVELNRDDLIHTLIYTLLESGGEAGIQAALDLADQMQAGQIRIPGQQTAALLMDTKMKHGGLGRVSRRAEVLELDEKELKHALSEAKGGMLVKKPTQIQALATLGRTRRPEAAEVLLELFGDKDPVIANAAQTALAQFFQPLPEEAEFTRTIEALLGQPRQLKGARLERLLDFIRRTLPKRPPYNRLYERQIEILIEDAELAHRLRGAALATDLPASPAGGEEGDGGAGEKPGASALPAAPISELDKKRAYLQARKAWIAGGKKGDEPLPPE